MRNSSACWLIMAVVTGWLVHSADVTESGNIVQAQSAFKSWSTISAKARVAKLDERSALYLALDTAADADKASEALTEALNR